jgi:hypothetical protein
MSIVQALDYYAFVENKHTGTVHITRQVHLHPGDVTLCGIELTDGTKRGWRSQYDHPVDYTKKQCRSCVRLCEGGAT